MTAVELDLQQQGGQEAEAVAAGLASWLGAARRSLDVAIYDFRPAELPSVRAALEGAVTRGVAVRVAYNLERSEHPAAPRPPRALPEELAGLSVPTRGIHGDGTLMHHKYVVRDEEAVWTGSMNWTADSFAQEENLVVRVQSSELAAAFRGDFEELWATGSVEHSGGSGPPVTVDQAEVQPFFSPRGPSLAHVVATRLGRVRHRVRLLSPVLTSGALLGTLAEAAAHASFDLVGAYDRTQMEEVQQQWAQVPGNRWKIEAWQVIAPRLSGKRSTPYREGAVHDYMHAKAVVVDGEVFTGSYNLSRGGEDNAENLVHVRDPVLADRVARFTAEVATRYAVPDAS